MPRSVRSGGRHCQALCLSLGLLETLLVANMITAEEYKERKAVYVELLLELYCLGIITQEQMNEKLNN